MPQKWWEFTFVTAVGLLWNMSQTMSETYSKPEHNSMDASLDFMSTRDFYFYNLRRKVLRWKVRDSVLPNAKQVCNAYAFFGGLFSRVTPTPGLCYQHIHTTPTIN